MNAKNIQLFYKVNYVGTEMSEQKKPLGYFIGHVNDANHRHRASSGGIGTMLQKYLLSKGQYGTSITFRFDAEKSMYVACLIHSAKEVNVCGSIYQDINIAQFVNAHIEEITNGIVVSCPPCQVAVIRNMLNKKNIPNFIISFCCSGQTTIEGTWKYYELLGVRKEDVTNMQYRGNGWPSGIQIWLKDGSKIYRENYTEPWKTLHGSWLFRPKRCFYCSLDISNIADISLADPWLKEYTKKDKAGNTLFIINTEKGEGAINELEKAGLVNLSPSDYNSFYYAQQPNVEKKNRIHNQKEFLHLISYFCQKRYIRAYFSQSLPRMKKLIKLRHYLQKVLF